MKALLFVTTIELDQFAVPCLALTYIENVEEIRNGLRIVGAGTAADNDRILVAAILRKERNLRQIENLKDVCVAHFILDGNAKEIKFLDGILGFQREKGNPVLPHNFFKINPWGEHPLAPDIFACVELRIQDLHAGGNA